MGPHPEAREGIHQEGKESTRMGSYPPAWEGIQHDGVVVLRRGWNAPLRDAIQQKGTVSIRIGGSQQEGGQGCWRGQGLGFRNVLRRGFARDFLEDLVEGGFGVESGVQRDGQDAVAAVGRLGDALLELIHPVGVHKIEEVFSFVLVDDLREVVGGNVQLVGQVPEGEFRFEVGFPGAHVVEQFPVVELREFRFESRPDVLPRCFRLHDLLCLYGSIGEDIPVPDPGVSQEEDETDSVRLSSSCGLMSTRSPIMTNFSMSLR